MAYSSNHLQYGKYQARVDKYCKFNINWIRSLVAVNGSIEKWTNETTHGSFIKASKIEVLKRKYTMEESEEDSIDEH